MKVSSLGERMKVYYEQPWNLRLPMRMPVIVRVDGKAFHTFTRQMERPYDLRLVKAMKQAAIAVCESSQTCVLAYGQSDEISFLLHNYKTLETQAYFDNEVQKLCSVMASTAAVSVALEYAQPVAFDARVFVLPESEVCNYFLWRQQDAARNSLQMLAQAHYSQKQLNGKNTPAMHDMLHEKGVNWNDIPTTLKRGFCVKRTLAVVERDSGEHMARYAWQVDDEIPLFSADRSYIEKHFEI